MSSVQSTISLIFPDENANTDDVSQESETLVVNSQSADSPPVLEEEAPLEKKVNTLKFTQLNHYT